MSAVLDTPLNGLGMIPLVSTIEGLNMSKSYRDALNTVVSACRGKLHVDTHLVTLQFCMSVSCLQKVKHTGRN